MKGLKCTYGVFFKDEKHYLQNDAAIIYDGENIIFAGSSMDAKEEFPEIQLEDLGNALIAPGFVDLDALGDIDHTLIDLDFSNHSLSEQFITVKQHQGDASSCGFGFGVYADGAYHKVK